MASPSLPGDTYYTLQLDVPKVGLKFNHVEITSVTPGSWAEKNGVTVDDEIYKVAGVPFSTLSREDRVRCIAQGGRPLTIEFKRPIYKDRYFTHKLTERRIGMTMKGKFVKTVENGGWAHRCGVKVGDEIAELQGKGYLEMTDEEKLKIFAGSRPIDIKFVRRCATQKVEKNDAEDWNLDKSNPASPPPEEQPPAPAPKVDMPKAAPEEKKPAGMFACCTCSAADKSNEMEVEPADN